MRTTPLASLEPSTGATPSPAESRAPFGRDTAMPPGGALAVRHDRLWHSLMTLARSAPPTRAGSAGWR